jgi:hypothetical protein
MIHVGGNGDASVVYEFMGRNNSLSHTQTHTQTHAHTHIHTHTHTYIHTFTHLGGTVHGQKGVGELACRRADVHDGSCLALLHLQSGGGGGGVCVCVCV